MLGTKGLRFLVSAVALVGAVESPAPDQTLRFHTGEMMCACVKYKV